MHKMNHSISLTAVLLSAALSGSPAFADLIFQALTLGELAAVDESGDIVINGDLHENQPSLADTPGVPDILVKNAAGDVVARFDSCNGDLYLAGELDEENTTLSSLTGSNFLIKNPSGTVVGAIDPSGNLLLAGTATVNDSICEGECSCD